MSNDCRMCRNARKICNEKQEDIKHGCVAFESSNLREINAHIESGVKVFSGWIYPAQRPDSKTKDPSPDYNIMVSTYIILNSNSPICSKWAPK